MPPRPALPTPYQAPANGANLFGPEDSDAALPLRFSKGELVLRWRRLLPFLPWAGGVAAGGAGITNSTFPFFDIEGPLLGIDDMTALRLEKAIDTAFAMTAVFRDRIMNYIRLHVWFPSPSSSCGHFLQAVRKHKLQMTPVELAVFTIRVADITKFAPRVAPYCKAVDGLAAGRKTCFNRRINEQNKPRQLKCGRARNSGHGEASSKRTVRVTYSYK